MVLWVIAVILIVTLIIFLLRFSLTFCCAWKFNVCSNFAKACVIANSVCSVTSFSMWLLLVWVCYSRNIQSFLYCWCPCVNCMLSFSILLRRWLFESANKTCKLEVSYWSHWRFSNDLVNVFVLASAFKSLFSSSWILFCCLSNCFFKHSAFNCCTTFFCWSCPSNCLIFSSWF